MTPLYDDAGRIRIYHFNTRSALAELGPVDHVITDPPYTARVHAYAKTSKGGTIHRQPIDFDPIDDDLWFVDPLLTLARRWVIVFCALEQLAIYQGAATPARYVRSGIWRRHSGPQFTGDRPAQSAEGIAIMHRAGAKRWNRGGCGSYWESPVVQGIEREHPTQKPESLIADLISDFTDPGDLILDPFMGSGTVLAAAKRLGRRAIGIELELKYCEMAIGRLAQGSLFQAEA